MRKINFLALVPLLIAGLPAQACISEVPEVTLQDLSGAAYTAGAICSLLGLLYMQLSKPTKAKIGKFMRYGMALTAMVLGLGAIAFGLTTVAPSVMNSLAHQSQTAPSLVPPHTVAPTTGGLMLHP